MQENDTHGFTRALGLLVIRTAALETTLVELIVRLVEDPSDKEFGQARMRFTGKSGKVLVEELRGLGRDEIADPYETLADQRNHLVHGNGWHLPEVGYHVVQAPEISEWNCSEAEAKGMASGRN